MIEKSALGQTATTAAEWKLCKWQKLPNSRQ
jgi:hypothetical protein